MTNLRKENREFSLGDFETVYAKGQVFAFLRELDGERNLVVMNNGDAAETVTIPVGNAGVVDGTRMRALLGDGQGLGVSRGAMKITVPAVDAVVLKLEAGAA